MKTREKGASLLLAAVMVLTLMFSGCGQAQTQSSTQSQSESQVASEIESQVQSQVASEIASQVASQAANGFSEGSGTAEDPYQIATAEQLDKVRDNLGACYALMEDIDLSGVENWEPIGIGVPDTSDPSGEVPTEADAFHGTFDGNGKAISGLTVSQDLTAETMGVGLFGTAANATIKNLTLKDATVTGNVMTAAAVGYSYSSTIENVDLIGENTITGVVNNGAATGNAPNMMAGIAGAGMDSTITNCDVSGLTLTMETLPDAAALTENAHDIGVLGGGLEGCTLSDCTASDSSVTVDGPYCFGIGGLSGCAMSAPSVSSCSTSNVTITMGDNAYLVGGLLGYTGIDNGTLTEVSDCKAENVAIAVGNGAERVGGILGGGFYLEIYVSYYPNPTSFSLMNCTASGSIAAPDGKAVGALVGCSYLSPINACTGNVTVNDEAADALGEDAALTALEGTYQGLFAPTIFKPEYDSLWIDYCSAVVGAESGEAMAEMMKASVGGSIHGQEAIDSYASAPDKMQFDCNYIGGIARLTFSGNTISGTDENGNEVFSHEYTYVSEEAIGADEGIDGFVGSLYQSSDDNADEFTYFLILPDTPETTYHIEFRYGSDIDALKEYATGKYAYWLAAGILENADEKMMEQVIALFCLENMDYSERSQSSVDQIADLVGTWDCDVSAYPEFAELGITGLYFIVDANGDGTTYAELNKSGEYTVTDTYNAYAYRNSNTDNSGIYVAYNPEEGEPQGSHYQITGNALSITTLDGEQISYTKRAAE